MMDAEDRELLARSLRHAVEGHSGAALDTALEGLGWREALAADPRPATATLFELQGAANATSSALDDVLAAALGPAVGEGVGVVLPPIGGTGLPGALAGAGAGPTVRGLGTAALGERASAVVVTDDGGKHAALLVPTAALTLRAVGGLDPRLGLVEVTGDGLRDAVRADVGPTGWDAAVAAGRRALGHELVGIARTMLALARDHAVERVQFGRPIAAFQAVRHRLAEALVAIESADAALAAAWDEPSPATAAMAKALAGRGARTAARHCQQVLAGIGFTTDHQLHRYVRRAIVLDELLGSGRTLTRELGEGILRDRRLPELPAL
jgi:hypothetical protein